jgi:hypothetical protein
VGTLSVITQVGYIMLTLARRARPDTNARRGDMAKRLPRPGKPTRQRCEVDEAELKAMETAAHACRLSVASWIRVALIAAAGKVTPEQVEAWNSIADRLREAAPPEQAKPGRPPTRAKKRKGETEGQ